LFVEATSWSSKKTMKQPAKTFPPEFLLVSFPFPPLVRIVDRYPRAVQSLRNPPTPRRPSKKSVQEFRVISQRHIFFSSLRGFMRSGQTTAVRIFAPGPDRLIPHPPPRKYRFDRLWLTLSTARFFRRNDAQGHVCPLIFIFPKFLPSPSPFGENLKQVTIVSTVWSVCGGGLDTLSAQDANKPWPHADSPDYTPPVPLRALAPLLHLSRPVFLRLFRKRSLLDF